MTDQILSAAIAAVVSLLVTLIGYFLSERRLIQDRTSAERVLAQKFAEELMRHRLRLYPKAFEITASLGKGDADDPGLVGKTREIAAALKAWKIGEVECVISEYAEDCFDDLIKRLKANPMHGNSYGRQHLNAIYQDRQKFRGALRKDLGILRASSRLYFDHNSLNQSNNTSA